MKKTVITIARSYGSGGRTLGKLLAEQLGINCYDREILRMASDASGINEALFGQADERLKRSPLFGILKKNPYKGGVIPPENSDFVSDDNLFNYQAKVIRDLAEKESCVIVGRCADYVLRNQERVLRCYLYAPDAYRASSVASLNLSTASEYQPLIDEVDKARASYYLKYTGYPVDNLELRDLVVNTACLGLEGTVEMLAAFAAKKFGLNLEEQA